MTNSEKVVSFSKLLFLVFISSFPFLTNLKGDFVFDDSEAVVKNKDVFSNSWKDCFFNDFWGTNIRSNVSHKSYRPLTVLSFRLNYFWNNNQLSASSFKVTNLLCHTLCCILVWLTYRELMNPHSSGLKYFDLSYYSALLFAVHPVHVEAVSGIVGRADILSGISFNVAFLLYSKCICSKKTSYLYLLLSIAFTIISMLFKENGVTVLGFCICYDFVKKMTTSKNKDINYILTDTMFLLRVSIVLISLLFILYGRWIIMDGSKPVFKEIDNPAAFQDNLFIKITTHSYIYFLNGLLLIWPQWLCYDWSMGCVPLIKSVSDYRIIFPILMYTFAVLLMFSISKKQNGNTTKRLLILGSTLTVISFLPAANVFYPVGFVIAERILYIPSIGYCLLISVGLHKLLVKTRKYNIVFILSILLIINYTLRSKEKSRDWLNEYQLFTSGLAVCPLNAKVNYNAAKVLDARSKTKTALSLYLEAIRLYPEYYQAMNNVGNLLKDQERYAEAEIYLKSAIKIKEDNPTAWMNLGIVLAKTGHYKESEGAYLTAIRYRNKYPHCYYNLGNLYLEMGKTEDALQSWLQTVNLNPKHFLAWTNLIALLDNTDQLDKAMELIPKALAEVPDAPSVNFAVANIFGKLDRFQESEKYFTRAINSFGKRNVQAIHYANLGVLYHRWKKYNKAEAMYKNALKLDPNFESASRNLKNLYKLTRH
ncbi:hypothetical protein ACJJTC_001309 [Scirpophaga incertulas]